MSVGIILISIPKINCYNLEYYYDHLNKSHNNLS